MFIWLLFCTEIYLLRKANPYFLEKSHTSKQQYKDSEAYFSIHLTLYHLSNLLLNFVRIDCL